MKSRLLKSTGTLLAVAGVVALMSSCKHETSGATAWNYNDPDWGGFEKVPFEEQETGPGLILIEGGTFTMGRVEQDVTWDWDNNPRRATVASFYMDQTEVTNFYWLEYLYWLDRIYGVDYPEVYKKALPDTLVWRDKLGYMEKYVEYYLRHPAYRDYPVVGVSWLQATDYCAWRTDRVNEFILIREGILYVNPNQENEPFTTDAYFANQYNLEVRELREDLNPNRSERHVRMEDGILLPRYRLPTEAEWEFASYGLIGNTYDERIVERRLYPWNGHWVRNPEDKFVGDFMANAVRGRGDYMGVAGGLNDAGDVTTPVFSYWPNDYGLYNMAGNVSEWVMDVYRNLSTEDMNEFMPFRGNVYETKVLNADGSITDKYDLTTYDAEGIMEYLLVFEKTRTDAGRMSDGDFQLLDICKTMTQEAIDLNVLKRFDEADEQIQFMIDDEINMVPDSVEIAQMLLKGISDYIVSTPGNVRWREVTTEENIDRRNYTEADNISFLDGDMESSIYYEIEPPFESDEKMYQTQYITEGVAMPLAPTSLINDKSRVYKGASWRDRFYWMNPGTRRYLDERLATATIGFRCAMDRVGSPIGLGTR